MAKQGIVLDIETQGMVADVGGWANRHLLPISLAVVYFIEEDRYRTYFEKDVQEMIDAILAADLVVGYNLLGFDYDVIFRHRDVDRAKVPTLDMCDYLYRKTGDRIRLDEVARGTLGEGKSGSGGDAVALFKDGRMKELEAYCRRDVEVTYRVYIHGKEKGWVAYELPGRGKIRTEVDW